MRLTDQIRYPVDPEAAFAMLREQEFHERKCVANGALEYHVQIKDTGDGGAIVTTRRVLPTATVPEFIRTLVGHTLTVTQVDEWGPAGADGGRDGSARVQIDGAPVRFAARLRLQADGRGSAQVVDGDLKASVPLIGSKIEKAAEPAIRAAIRAEQRTANAWFAPG